MADEDSTSGAPNPADSFILRYLYRPEPGAILYHYCSMEAFEAIIRTGKIRMSDINMMNDFSEMRWGYSVFEEAASQILKTREQDESLPDREFFDAIDAHLAPTQLVLHPLIASFSKNRDVLSQWRGYAADGTGVCIGFDAEKLTQICAAFLNCEYNHHTQVEQMVGRLLAAHSLGDEISVKEYALHLFGFLPALKNPAFREEAEVRAVHLLTVGVSDEGVELLDPGGCAFGADVEGTAVEFTVRNGGLVAHVDVRLFESEPDRIITEVVMGPKNTNLAGNISACLVRHGHRGVRILQSAATYR